MPYNQEGQEDLRIWREYKNAKDQGNKTLAKQKARELYDQMQGVIKSQTNKYRNVGLPQIGIESEAREKFMQALDKYDPTYGSKLSTFVTQYLKGVGNYVKKYKDVAKIQQSRQQQLYNYSKTKDDLNMKLNREPNAREMAEAMKWDIDEARRMEQELQRDEYSASGLLEAGELQDFSDDPEIEDTIRMVYLTLNGDEQLVMEYLMGYNGKKKLETGKDIARATGMSPAKVSRVRKKLKEKIEQYL